MYTFSKKLKTTALILMALGLVGIVYGFLAAPKTVEEAEKIIALSHHEEHNEEAVKEDSRTLELPAEAVATNGAVANILAVPSDGKQPDFLIPAVEFNGKLENYQEILDRCKKYILIF